MLEAAVDGPSAGCAPLAAGALSCYKPKLLVAEQYQVRCGRGAKR